MFIHTSFSFLLSDLLVSSFSYASLLFFLFSVSFPLFFVSPVNYSHLFPVFNFLCFSPLPPSYQVSLTFFLSSCPPFVTSSSSSFPFSSLSSFPFQFPFFLSLCRYFYLAFPSSRIFSSLTLSLSLTISLPHVFLHLLFLSLSSFLSSALTSPSPRQNISFTPVQRLTRLRQSPVTSLSLRPLTCPHLSSVSSHFRHYTCPTLPR